MKRSGSRCHNPPSTPDQSLSWTTRVLTFVVVPPNHTHITPPDTRAPTDRPTRLVVDRPPRKKRRRSFCIIIYCLFFSHRPQKWQTIGPQNPVSLLKPNARWVVNINNDKYFHPHIIRPRLEITLSETHYKYA